MDQELWLSVVIAIIVISPNSLEILFLLREAIVGVACAP